MSEIVLNKTERKLGKFLRIIIFFYFLSLHADQISFSLGDYTFRWNNIIAGILALGLIYVLKGNCVFSGKMIFSLFLLIFSATISLTVMPSLRSVFFLSWFLFSLFFYFVIPFVLIRNFSGKQIIFLYFASFLVVEFYAGLQLLASLLGYIDPFISQFVGKNSDIVRPNAFAYEPSFYVLYLVPLLSMITFSYIFSSKVSEEKYFFLKKNRFLCFVCHVLFLISMTTSSLLFYFLFFIFLFLFSLFFRFLNIKNVIKKMTGVLVILGMGLFSLPYYVKFFFLKFFFSPIHSLESFSERFCGMKVCWKIWLKHPFLGVGLGNVPEYCYREFISGNQEMLFRFTSMIKEKNYFKVFEPSSVFTEILASLGFFGVIAFSFFLGNIWKSFAVAFKRDAYLSLNLFLSVIVMLCMLQINQGLLRTYVWVHLGIVFGWLENIGQEELVTKQSGAVSIQSS